MRAMYHATGQNACNGIAFYIVDGHVLELGKAMRAEDYITFDGSHPEPETRPICESCGKWFNPRIDDIRESDKRPGQNGKE